MRLRRRAAAAAALVLVLAALASWGALQAWPRNAATLTVAVLNVGQGDAVLVRFPSGRQWLIDGGPDESVVAAIDATTWLMSRRLDGVVLTHPHADHVAGLVPVLRRFHVGQVLMADATHTTPEYLAFLEEVRDRSLSVTAVDHPFAWEGEDKGVPWRWEFLYPTAPFAGAVRDLNAVSVVSRLTFGETSFLFMGDAPAEVERLLAAQGRALKADVLKVGHHGSDTSTSEELLEAAQPRHAAISVGAGNRFGHPSPAVLKRLGDYGVAVHRTDERGGVTFRTDGQTLTVTTER